MKWNVIYGVVMIEGSIRNSQFLDQGKDLFILKIYIDRKIDSKFMIFRLEKDIDKKILIGWK